MRRAMADLEWHGTDGEWTSGPYRIWRVAEQACVRWRLDVVAYGPTASGNAVPRLVGEYDSVREAKAIVRRLEADSVHRRTVTSYVGMALFLGLAAAVIAPTVGTLLGFLVINVMVGLAINRLVCAWDIHMDGPSGVPQRRRSGWGFNLARSLRSQLQRSSPRPDAVPASPMVRVLPPLP